MNEILTTITHFMNHINNLQLPLFYFGSSRLLAVMTSAASRHGLADSGACHTVPGSGGSHKVRDYAGVIAGREAPMNRQAAELCGAVSASFTCGTAGSPGCSHRWPRRGTSTMQWVTTGSVEQSRLRFRPWGGVVLSCPWGREGLGWVGDGCSVAAC